MRFFKFFYLFFLLGAGKQVQALEVDITQGTFQPIPIIFLLQGDGGELSKELREIIQGDLEGCGLFQSLRNPFLPQTAMGAFSDPSWGAWKQTGAQILLTGVVMQEGESITFKCRLMDVFGGRELQAFSLTGLKEQKRVMAHKISDAIYERLTGHSGYFNTQIIYVSSSGKGSKQSFRICVIDQDGWNKRNLDIKGHLLKGPQFSSSGKKIIYVSNRDRTEPQAFIYDLEKQRETLIPTKGRIFSARFIPGKDQVILSVIREGKTYLGLYSLDGEEIRSLVQSRGIDVSPSCAPDGQAIVFNSDRGGSPQLYRLGLEGGEPVRLSWSKGKYFAPVWSPQQNRIAFIRREGGFFLGVMTPEGEQEKLIASFYLVDTPSWAPNGQALVFSAKESPSKASQLYSIDLSSLKVRKITTLGEALEPCWSCVSLNQTLLN